MICKRSIRSVVAIGLGLSFGSACTASDDPSKRIAITEANPQGATAIEIDRFERDGDAFFELRGLDARGAEVARISLRTGTVAELPAIPSGELLGSELTFSVGDDTTRVVTRETVLIRMPAHEDPATQAFMELGPVTSALHDAGIWIEQASSIASGEVALGHAACPPPHMLTSPLAQQCCQSASTAFFYTLHVMPGKYGRRDRNPNNGTPCRASNGTSACNGSACYYGPNGFARPLITFTSSYIRIEIEGGGPPYGTWCGAHTYATPQTPIFANVTGTFPTGQGCPNVYKSTDTGAGQWDY